MELFSVQRYTEEEKTNHDPKKSEEILQKLLKKAKKRKLEQELEVQETPAEVPQPVKEQEPLADAEIEQNEEQIAPTDEQVAGQEESEDFQVLGSNLFEKKAKVEMILPPWLAHPTVIATAIQEAADTEEDSITGLSYLSDDIRASLKGIPIKKLFPVQEAVIPWVLQSHSKPYPFRPRDICVSAPTGSGKTLAFAIPIVQLLSNRVEKKIRALVVLPVAELALQVFKVLKKLAEKTDLSVCLLSTSVPFSGEQQKLVECYKGKFYSKVDIVVTTPGRLVEHLHSTKGFCLKSLKFLVIDEADRIMDQVHHNWLYHLDEHVKSTSDSLLSGRTAPLCVRELETSASCQPHKMLFSATLSQDPEKLQNLRLFQPKLFTSVLANLDELKEKFTEKDSGKVSGEFIGKYTTPAELTEKYCLTEMRLKPLTLYSLITENDWTKFLCFTNSAESSGRLAFVLQYLFKGKLKIGELSASMNPKNRANILSEFTRGKINGLVSSDALARGIDIPDVDIVISYDPARHIKTYIHRIGRTARAGRPGTAITLLDQKEFKTFSQTLAEVGKALTLEIKVTVDTEESMAQLYATALKELRSKLEQEKHSKVVMKNIAKEKAKPVDPSKMTLMEKLQAEATNKVLEKATAVVENETVGKRKKKNPNSSKAFKLKKSQKLGKVKNKQKKK